jgi:hypothetical protein
MTMTEKFDLPRYMDALMKLAGKQPGQVIEVNIAHDDWCAHWKGGACNCNPSVTEKTGGRGNSRNA